MKILLTNDIHLRMDWFAWLSGQEVDLTVIAGDVLDARSNYGTMAQMLAVRKWVNRFHGMLALCSGNHDANTGTSDYMLDPIVFSALPKEKKVEISEITKWKYWMDSLCRVHVVTDRRSRLIETPNGKLVVTSIPFTFDTEPDPISKNLWEQGAKLRRKTGAPWLVLHHLPPAGTKVAGDDGDSNLFYRIRMWKPDFLVSGHVHGQPYRGSFADRLASTWLFNAGRPDVSISKGESIPNHIVLNLTDRNAIWDAASPDGRIVETKLLY